MLDEKRIKLMTELAAYENSEGKNAIPICGYFRSDYICFNVVKTIISATISFGLIFGLYVYYNMESFVQDMYRLDLLEMGKQVLLYYLIFASVYALIGYIIYSIKYDRAKRSLVRYQNALKSLLKMYNEKEM